MRNAQASHMVVDQWRQAVSDELHGDSLRQGWSVALGSLLRTAPAGAVDAAIPEVAELAGACLRAGLGPQMWAAFARNRALEAQWWATQGLGIAAVGGDVLQGVLEMLTALGPRLTQDLVLLAGLLDRVAEPVASPPAHLPAALVPAGAGEATALWMLVASSAVYGIDSSWPDMGADSSEVLALFSADELVWVRAIWGHVMGSYRAGLLRAVPGGVLASPAAQGNRRAMALCCDARAGLWPDLTSVALLDDAGWPEKSPATARVRASLGLLLGSQPGSAQVSRWLEWAVERLPARARVGDVLSVVGDVLDSREYRTTGQVMLPPRAAQGPGLPAMGPP